MRLTVLLLLSLCAIAPATGKASDAIIHFPEDDSFLPKSWVEEPIEAVIEPLDGDLEAAARGILQAALKKYPEELLKEFLDGVYVVGSLRFYDVGYGGTYMANAERIVLVYRASFDARGFEQRFHHEFSSILLKKNEEAFEEVRWKKGNPPGYVYRAPGVIEEQSGDRSEATKVLEAEQKKTGGSGSGLLRLDEELMKEGFLTQYNRVSIEQDLNETAAHLFTNPALWAYCRDYPRVDHKVDVLIDFYRTLDPVFDRYYFRELTIQPEETDAATP
ncbi:MAG: hypothetical protein P1U68_09525 [Verrucomicrobiales bacterium]|nr:hypothetical protein [Verrucomicrobiales bacterium]